jgi:hypothetical protein
VAEGTPEQVASIKASYTGRFLAPLLPRANAQDEARRRSRVPRQAPAPSE